MEFPLFDDRVRISKFMTVANVAVTLGDSSPNAHLPFAVKGTRRRPLFSVFLSPKTGQMPTPTAYLNLRVDAFRDYIHSVNNIMASKVSLADEMNGLAVSSKMPAKKKSANPCGAAIQGGLGTNIYKLGLQQVPVYRYDVDIVLKVNGRDVKVVKKDAADFVIIENKDKARQTFLKIVEKFPNVFGKAELFYDCQSILFALKKLDIPNSTPKEFTLTPAEIPKVYGNVDAISFVVKTVTDKYQLTLNDLSFLNSSEVKGVKHDLAQFIEVATSQEALFGGRHSVYEGGKSFFMASAEPVKFENSKALVTGIEKSVRFIEGAGKPETGLVLDVHKSVFHKGDQNLFVKATQSIRSWPRNDRLTAGDVHTLNKQFRKLWVLTTHQRERKYELDGLCNDTARTKKFECDGREISVFDYFQKQYNIRLQHPDAPLATVKNFFQGRKNITYLPLEVCTVLPNQRVSHEQQTPTQTASVIRFCAILPADRKNQGAAQAKELGLWNGKAKTLPYTIDTQPMVVQGRLLPVPTIAFGANSTVTVNPANGRWNATDRAKGNMRLPFVKPSALKLPWAVGVLGRGSTQLGKNFADAIKKELNSRGYPIDAPLVVKQINYDQVQLGSKNNFFEELTKMTPRIKFCFIIEDENSGVHGQIKANEQRHKIITQVVELRTVEKFNFAAGPATGYGGNSQTLENITLKTHIKMGGLNHAVKPPPGYEKVFNTERMYVGLGISHAAPLTEAQRKRNMKPTTPSVIGFTCNYLGHIQELAGSFVFQEPREDRMVEQLRKLFKELAEKFQKCRKALPKEVYVYRVGASDGQYASILEGEVPQMRAGLQDAGCKAKLVLVVPSKTHNVRIFPTQIRAEDKAPAQNLKPGTVVDSGIVHPQWPEFYLNSHTTLQGSAKTPRYNVLVDDTGAPIHEHEMAAYMWAYGHQIVGSPTSLPTPGYIANKYAERGRVLAQQAGREEFVGEDGNVDFELMTKKLTFAGTPLANFRVNA
ncbi:hypothetical protein QR680_018566 [Steinernema hermaphroditum]|uniref:Piwi domain-containing protein n=1 Tax=Steinernema hermaphroditum TaxID=289476 RepID=A0AA39LR80_9BILA|nr:hypothetical protein QR680_018566 [Steinernema hermaphroditum]